MGFFNNTMSSLNYNPVVDVESIELKTKCVQYTDLVQSTMHEVVYYHQPTKKKLLWVHVVL